jgi:hypothetical protein
MKIKWWFGDDYGGVVEDEEEDGIGNNNNNNKSQTEIVSKRVQEMVRLISTIFLCVKFMSICPVLLHDMYFL